MDVEVLLRKLRREGRSDSCLAQCRGMLFQIFNKAEANDLVNKNPVRFAEKMRKRPPKRKEAFTAEEVRLLLKELPENKIGWSIRLLLCTGMRTQELLGLEPRHIAEDGSTILIEQAVVMEKGTAMIGTPKSFDSYRCVPVPANFRYCARLLRDTDKKFVWEMDKRLDYPCNPSTFRTKYKEAIEAVPGVRYLSPHSCRHTYVSQMQALGVDLQTIQSIVGHADVDMTEHYLHVQEPKRLEAVDLFSKAFGIPTD
jgi:integrase